MSVLIKKQSYLLPVVWPVLVSYRLIRYQLWYGIYTAYIIFASLFAAIAAEIYAGNQHTHANPPEQLLAGQLLLRLCGQPLACQLQHEIQLLRQHHVDKRSKWRHVHEVQVSRRNPLAGRPFLVPLMTRCGLIGDGCQPIFAGGQSP